MKSIVLSYAGVHQIFQLALAAHEMGRLDALHCSMLDAPGKMGRYIARGRRSPTARPLDGGKLPLDRVHEFPWPFLIHQIALRLLPWRTSDHWFTNGWFDSHVAGLLRRSDAGIFVGAETCAQKSMQTAKDRGMKCVLDCPGIPADFLDEQAVRAAHACGVDWKSDGMSARMKRQKENELKLADVILACSEFQKVLLADRGADVQRIKVVPLWADTAFWQGGPGRVPASSDGKLRILYAGAISLKKGVPYLLQAARSVGDKATLTLVGSVSREMHGILRQHESLQCHPYVSKDRLRELHQSHDVLVMPSLGDSFGFVALEAMASGMPVIVSAHCGVPVPDESWRVPAANSDAIVERLSIYAKNRELVAQHGAVAARFATEFSPERYRATMRGLFGELLDAAA